MSARKYISKPVEIEALRWNGSNTEEVILFGEGSIYKTTLMIAYLLPLEDILKIKTLEGRLKARKGDYIIKGTEGELYPCKPSVFERKYELKGE